MSRDRYYRVAHPRLVLFQTIWRYGSWGTRWKALRWLASSFKRRGSLGLNPRTLLHPPEFTVSMTDEIVRVQPMAAFPTNFADPFTVGGRSVSSTEESDGN